MDKFIRRANVGRFRRLLERTIDEVKRKQLEHLLAKGRQKQKDAGDPEIKEEFLPWTKS
jgi:hypothetical protein